MLSSFLNDLPHWGHVFVWEWLDITWIPLAWMIVHRSQRLKATGFILLCMAVLRLQIDIAHSFGASKGLTGFFDWPLILRGYATYGFFIFLFLVLSYFSPRTRGAVYLAASLTIFFMAFAVSSIVLIF